MRRRTSMRKFLRIILTLVGLVLAAGGAVAIMLLLPATVHLNIRLMVAMLTIVVIFFIVTLIGSKLLR